LISDTSASILRQILRSVCADGREQTLSAVENWSVLARRPVSPGPLEQGFLDAIAQFYTQHGGPPSLTSLRGWFDRKSKAELSILVGELAASDFLWGANFSAAVEALRERNLGMHVARAVGEMSQIVGEGMELRLPDGRKEILQGPAAAAHHGLSLLTEAVRAGGDEYEVHDKTTGLSFAVEEYQAKRDKAGERYGMTTGIQAIDEATMGGQPGELWLWGGFTGHGKTTFLLNWIRRQMYYGQSRCLLFSQEMSSAQVWRILLCIHANDPEVQVKHIGRTFEVPYSHLKAGILDPDVARFVMLQAERDLRECGGDIQVIRARKTMTMDEVWAIGEQENRRCPIDMFGIDYLGLLESATGKGRKTKGDRINENILRAKEMSMAFDRGRGVFVASPHQINRQGYLKAKANGGIYDLDAMADANEAERSADAIFTSYVDDGLQALEEAVCCNLKSRDSAVLPPFRIQYINRRRWIGSFRKGSDGGGVQGGQFA
jgi:hypothetical protein